MKNKTDIENLFSESLENLHVQPSDALKQRVDKSLIWVNLLHYQLVKIICGIGAVGVIIGIFLYFFLSGEGIHTGNNSQNIINNQNSNSLSGQNIEMRENNSNNKNYNYSDTAHLDSEYITDDNILSKSKTDELLKSNKNENYNDNSTVLTTKHVVNANIGMVSHSVVKNGSGIDEKKSNIRKDLKNNNTEVIVNGNSKINVSNENDYTEANESITKGDAISENNISGVNTVKSDISGSALSKSELKEGLLATNETGIWNKKDFMPRLPLHNNGIPEVFNASLAGRAIDSTFIQAYLKKQNTWFADVYWSSALMNTHYGSKDIEYDPVVKQKNNAFSQMPTFSSFGIRGGYFKNKIMLMAGIGISQFSENYKYDLVLNNPRQQTNLVYNNTPYDFEQNQAYYNIDTIGGYYHFTWVQDSIIHVFDSVWVNLTDTNQVNVFDTVRSTVYDSLINKSYLNNYTYLEFPLSVGYRFQSRNIDITPMVGIVTGILVRKAGMNISDDMQNLEIPLSKLPYRKINLAGKLSLNMNYNITEKIGVWIEPVFRKSILSEYKSGYVIQRKTTIYELRLGARIKF